MTLTERIERERKTVRGYEHAIKEAREKLWDAAFVTRNDERRKHEDGTLEDREHWERRRKRNREAYEHRDEVVEHLVKKRNAHEKLIDKLKDLKEEVREERSSGFQKGSTKIVTMDGKPIVEDLAYWLDKARHNGWHGVVVSGYRSPEYSESLCRAMCGAPSCPGRCAGRASNHARVAYPGPAADVTDFITCERVLANIGAPYFNDLPYDLVHFSRSGH